MWRRDFVLLYNNTFQAARTPQKQVSSDPAFCAPQSKKTIPILPLGRFFSCDGGIDTSLFWKTSVVLSSWCWTEEIHLNKSSFSQSDCYFKRTEKWHWFQRHLLNCLLGKLKWRHDFEPVVHIFVSSQGFSSCWNWTEKVDLETAVHVRNFLQWKFPHRTTCAWVVLPMKPVPCQCKGGIIEMQITAPQLKKPLQIVIIVN